LNWGHLRATLWLRRRILVNRIRRTGKLNNVVFGLLVFVGTCLCVGLFFVSLELGLSALPDAEPIVLMGIWFVLAAAFLFFWMVGLLMDLQRSDAMSFQNLLHLPVSLGWVFLYNYLSSFVSVSMAIFLPAMLGLCLAMVLVNGPLMLLGFPLVLAFLVMITAITYQLRGWLAHLMKNKRRGRNIIAGITVGFVLLVQLPNVINMQFQESNLAESRQQRKELRELREVAHQEGPEQAAAKIEIERRDLESQRELDIVEGYITLGTMIVPLGWLPYGVRAAAEGRMAYSVLCALGMLLIGAWSLRRSFRTTLSSVVGGSSAGNVAAASLPGTGPSSELEALAEDSGERKTLLVERSLPFTCEAVSGIALAGLRSLMRAPEIKMLVLSPVILLGLFGVMLSSESNHDMLVSFAPMLSLGAIAMGLLCIIQLLQNQFGLDRAGFRAYVLSPVPRHQILLGKNLAIAPMGVGIGLIALIGLQILFPADFSHFLGGLLQLLSAYMLLCMVGNMISIFAPMRLKENTLKAANAKFKAVLFQILLFFLVPLTLSPLMIPSGVEFFFGKQDWAQALPLYPLLHGLGLVVISFFYRWMLREQGASLQNREQRILDVLMRD
jgi:hypothetical protein